MNQARLNLPRQSAGAAIVFVALGLASTACGGSEKVAVSAQAPDTSRPETLQHEDCPEAANRVELLDTDGDGKPDIRKVLDKSSGRELCRSGDLDHDGKPELYEYFDSSGAIRRREFCYNDSGDVNAIEHYEHGKLVRREYDAAGQRRIDTWDWFDPNVPLDPKTGRPAHPTRRERDTRGDGHIDQWWTWNDDKVTIAVDVTADGVPDPSATIVLGAGGTEAVSSSPDTAAAAPAAPDGGAPVSAAADGGQP